MRWVSILALPIACWLALGCEAPEPSTPDVVVTAPPDIELAAPPNILWVVWDTVRADRMSVYGYERPTTPFLEEWSREARVFDDVVSVASTTVPAHVSMFTGLLPSEHGANNRDPVLSEAFPTLAERLRDGGYDTYLFAANPHLAPRNRIVRGFDIAQYPWEDAFRDEVREIARRKLAQSADETEVSAKGTQGFHGAGAVAKRGLETWLAGREGDAPFFAFLNYMEAHAPTLPDRAHRQRFMDEDRLTRSWEHSIAGLTTWNFTAGISDLTPEKLDLVGRLYDAALAELDDLFRELLASLEADGHLENTVVILTSDHGELLGEHHMLDHQFALHRELLHVPLLVWWPGQVAPGREPLPVSNIDLHRMVLDLSGVGESGETGFSALGPREGRVRIAEYPRAADHIASFIETWNPGFDGTSLRRALRAIRKGPYKLIQGSDGSEVLYDVVADPAESLDLAASQPAVAADLRPGRWESSDPDDDPVREVADPELEQMLRELGYLPPEGPESGSPAPN